MSEHDDPSIPFADADDNDRASAEEIQDVLAALRRLADKIMHPVVRTCLEQAHDDIVHLTSHGDESQVDDGEPAAA